MASSKRQQILDLSPQSEIVFEGPYDKVVTSYLEIRNNTNEKVCFKVKTTAPRRYCVRPNSGIVTPGSKMRIAIMLQPIEQESQSERSRHKFMVQSVVIPNGDISLEELWKTVTQDDIMDSKLRCVFQVRTQESQSADNNLASSQQSDRTGNKTTATQAQLAAAEEAKPDIVRTSSQKSIIGTASSAATTPVASASISEPKTQKTNKQAGDVFTRSLERPITSTPTRPTKGPTKTAANVSSTSLSIEHQNSEFKIVIVSLIMLILGVIMGKYII